MAEHPLSIVMDMVGAAGYRRGAPPSGVGSCISVTAGVGNSRTSVPPLAAKSSGMHRRVLAQAARLAP